ncbi:acetyl-CoA carboxylase biotin carboxylase subunit family protein [Streptomyces sp. NPDC055966]|uniref:ATP-grasp domain-containing protein n=1 Tax=Streptomyces sp. NPDC055966 TaxID=3345669 RepID=UPI0035D8E53A
MPKVLLYSRQPLTKRPLQQWLDDTADSVVLLTTHKAAAGAEDVLDAHFPAHRLVDDYYAWSTELAAEEAARAHGAELVASTSEDDVLRAARLRERLGLPGQGTASATAYRDKAVMKTLLRDAGLAVPSFALVDSPLDLLDFLDTEDGPVVVKPRSGAGAEGVSVLRSPADLEAFLARQKSSEVPFLAGQWMAEGFVHGDFFHVDGIMRDGRIVHCWPSQYNSGVAEHLQGQTQLSSVLLAADDERTAGLRTLAQDVVAALPPAPLPLAFHLEAWLGADGRLIVCEIASRAGGGLIADAYERAFGVHLAKEGLRAQCGSALTLAGQPAAPEPPTGWILFPPGHGRFAPPVEPCPVPGVDLIVHLEPGTECTGLEYAAQSAAGALVTGDSPQEIRKRLTLLTEWWNLHTSWL